MKFRYILYLLFHLLRQPVVAQNATVELLSNINKSTLEDNSLDYLVSTIKRHFIKARHNEKYDEESLHETISRFLDNEAEKISKSTQSDSNGRVVNFESEEKEDYETKSKGQHNSKGKGEIKSKKDCNKKSKQPSTRKSTKSPKGKGRRLSTVKTRNGKGKGGKKDGCEMSSPSAAPSLTPTMSFDIANCDSYNDIW